MDANLEKILMDRLNFYQGKRQEAYANSLTVNSSVSSEEWRVEAAEWSMRAEEVNILISLIHAAEEALPRLVSISGPQQSNWEDGLDAGIEIAKNIVETWIDTTYKNQALRGIDGMRQAAVNDKFVPDGENPWFDSDLFVMLKDMINRSGKSLTGSEVLLATDGPQPAGYVPSVAGMQCDGWLDVPKEDTGVVAFRIYIYR